MKDVIKSHLLVQDRFIAALLYFKDKNGRGHLKLSFKNKLQGFTKGTDLRTTLPVPAKLNIPIGIDVSYKFLDSLLEVKKIVDHKIEREFYDVVLPIQTCLFVVKIKDWKSLDISTAAKNPLILDPPTDDKGIAVVFSFLNNEGRPVTPKEYSSLMGVIDLPETFPMNKFCIGVSGDSSYMKEGFRLEIPMLQVK